MRNLSFVLVLFFAPLAAFAVGPGEGSWPSRAQPARASSDGLATFSITQEINGMRIPNAPPGAGDKELNFSLHFPANNRAIAVELWYLHLGTCLGEQSLKKLEEAAKSFNP